jgi:hypothetical protein
MGMVACFAAVSVDDMRRLVDDPDLVPDYLYPDDGESEPPHYVDLDKAWHAIDYMLVGPSGNRQGIEALAVLGGLEIGEDMGYGPARLLLPELVRDVAELLEPLTAEVLAARYDPKAMDEADIYPQIWERDGAEGLDYILHFYGPLRTFYLEARDRGDAALLWIS